MRNEYREWLKSKGICVNCCSEKVWNNTTMCIECLDKHKERSEKSRSEKSKEQRRRYVKRKRDLCIAFGVCRECFKRDKKVGKMCLECHVKSTKRNKAKRNIPREKRANIGLCYFCAEDAIDGKKVCEKHYKIVCSNLSKAHRDNSNHIWRKLKSAEIKKVLWYKEKNKNKDENNI